MNAKKIGLPSAALSIREAVGENRAVVFVSGGVDSAVAATLARQALGARAAFYFIDNGLQRRGEARQVKESLGEAGIEVSVFDASGDALERMAGCVTGPEKRAAAGEILVEKALEIARAERAKHLVFGTIQNDLRVSAGGPKRIRGFELVEPLAGFAKDQVLDAARRLGLPETLWSRPHFPGVGFAVRMEGPVTRKKLALIQELTERVERQVRRLRLHKKLWAYFPILLSSEGRGKHAVVLRLVESRDGLEADLPRINRNQLIRLREEILGLRADVGRVYLDLTPKPFSSIELM